MAKAIDGEKLLAEYDPNREYTLAETKAICKAIESRKAPEFTKEYCERLFGCHYLYPVDERREELKRRSTILKLK